MTLSPEVQAILDRVKAGEPELTAAEKRERRKAERAAKPKVKREPKPRPAKVVGPHGSWRPALPDDVQQTLVAEYQDGATIKGLAESHGLNGETVRNVLRWHDVWVPGRRPKTRRDLCPITLLALWDQGLSVWSISRQVGAAYETTAARLEDLGVQLVHRQGGGRPPSDVCTKAGHPKELGARCRECKRIRQRDWRRQKTAAQKAAATAAA